MCQVGFWVYMSDSTWNARAIELLTAIPVSPGFNNYIDIAVDIHHRLKAPYRSDCTTQTQLDVYDNFR